LLGKRDDEWNAFGERDDESSAYGKAGRRDAGAVRHGAERGPVRPVFRAMRRTRLNIGAP